MLPDLPPLYQKNITKVAAKINDQKIQNDICSELYDELFENDNTDDSPEVKEPKIPQKYRSELYNQLMKANKPKSASKSRESISSNAHRDFSP